MPATRLETSRVAVLSSAAGIASTLLPNTLYISINAVRALSILLYPFIPNSASKIWSQLNNNQKLEEESWESLSLLKILPTHRIGKVSPIFKKIERKEIEKEKLKLGSISGSNDKKNG